MGSSASAAERIKTTTLTTSHTPTQPHLATTLLVLQSCSYNNNSRAFWCVSSHSIIPNVPPLTLSYVTAHSSIPNTKPLIFWRVSAYSSIPNSVPLIF
ncbi:hypothetical protein J6590_071608 [Homalodisca vitripennis]|nr:hypothetical protein J6590_071608 [Homalodisca vitripennis]